MAADRGDIPSSVGSLSFPFAVCEFSYLMSSSDLYIGPFAHGLPMEFLNSSSPFSISS